MTTKNEAKKEVDISAFISNPKGNVYAVTGLPEEFVATLFAWVSRSPKSFKEHLKEAIKEFDIKAPKDSPFKELDKKAKDFHEKWTVGFGHSSVAEHAVAHIGIEKVSRLASAELELSNTFLSITEYSQRYQKPKRGDWHNPFKKNTKDYKKFEEFMNEAFDTFETLITELHKYLINKETDNGSKKISEKRSKQLEKLAFEDARYVLPLAMYTQLGMTANGRAWRDALSVLGSSDYKESVELQKELKKEISKVLPTLLKYADPSSYQMVSRKNKSELFKSFINSIYSYTYDANVKLLQVESEQDALYKIISLFLVEEKGYSFDQAKTIAKSMKREKLEEIVQNILDKIDFFDVPPEAFKHINYQAEFEISEANWHQLLRHNRKTNFVWSKPTVEYGVVIPPKIAEAGLEPLVAKITQKAEDLYEELDEFHRDYVVLNAHKRKVVAEFDLWEAYHLINLRTGEDAQWEIRSVFNKLYDLIKSVQPVLISKAKRR